jgi:hypothetical protein
VNEEWHIPKDDQLKVRPGRKFRHSPLNFPAPSADDNRPTNGAPSRRLENSKTSTAKRRIIGANLSGIATIARPHRSISFYNKSHMNKFYHLQGRRELKLTNQHVNMPDYLRDKGRIILSLSLYLSRVVSPISETSFEKPSDSSRSRLNVD